MIRNHWKTILIALCTSVGTLAIYKFSGLEKPTVVLSESRNGDSTGKLVNLANLPAGTPGDFTYAASIGTPAVVHIKATSVRAVRQRMPSIFDDFFGFDMGDDFFGAPRNQQQQSSGSGVIISEDGYIATNNHVVEGADKLEVVTFDKRTFEATVVGVDPSTDIAVIKIDGKSFPTLSFGISDEVKVGEWVLAVGNPFNLESTVTAGIVSAIGRSINILDQSFGKRIQRGEEVDTPIESFIQTDAAVNPGNSGGALINLNGELIGINTAIASPNGAYAGYAFAVPSSTVKKVTTDLIKYGNVQRGYLQLNPVGLNDQNAKELGSKLTKGIYVQGVVEDGAADKAGIQAGDVIVQVDGIQTISEPRFRELIGRKRPGETVEVVVNRDGKEKKINVTLRNREGGKTILKEKPSSAVSKLGLKIEDMKAPDLENLGLKYGVKVTGIDPSGIAARDTDIKKDFIITRVGNSRATSAEEVYKIVNEAITNKQEGILICGVYPGISRNFCFGMPLQ